MENEIWTLKNPSGYLNNGLRVFSKMANEKMARVALILLCSECLKFGAEIL